MIIRLKITHILLHTGLEIFRLGAIMTKVLIFVWTECLINDLLMRLAIARIFPRREMRCCALGSFFNAREDAAVRGWFI